MFLKPFRVKSNTTCKSSERKRLKGRICSSYPSLSQATLDELLPSKCTLASVRVFTHSNSNVTIFTINDEPLFFEHEGNFCPTVYSLWKYPEMLPSVSTGPYVFTKLQGGADLMLPGVILPKLEVPELKGVERGQLCSVNLIGNRASVGVGVALMSYDAMEANQWRGKGFKVLHLYGDRLWELGSKGGPPQLLPHPQVFENKGQQGQLDDVSCTATGPDEGITSPEQTTKNESLVSLDRKLGDMEMNDTTESVDLSDVKLKPTTSGTTLLVNVNDDLSGYGIPVEESSHKKLENMSEVDDQSSKVLYGVSGDCIVDADDESIEATPSSVPPMDDLLSECLYMAIKSSIKKEDLPILTSTFYRAHMKPLCPLEFSLDIKKSRYKKLSKFLSAMQDEGVLKIKETSKGVESITDIDFKHTKVKGIVPKYIHSEVKTIGESSSASATSIAASNASAGVPQMTITELYIPTRKVLRVFSPYGYSTATMMTHSMVREVVTRYIKERELTSPANSKLVILDPILTDAILKRGEAPPTELLWQQIMTRMLEEMRPGYSIQQGADEPVYKRSKLEPVRLIVTTRMGNKKATLVDNLDYYGISPVDVVHQVQRIAAASATVSNMIGQPQRQQVMVQGSNVRIIAKLLQEQHGLPLKYIEAVDKTKVPKTQKRQGSKR